LLAGKESFVEYDPALKIPFQLNSQNKYFLQPVQHIKIKIKKTFQTFFLSIEKKSFAKIKMRTFYFFFQILLSKGTGH